MPIEGLGPEKESRLSEIEYFVRTGKRADERHPTTAWIREALRFVVAELREALDDNAQMSLTIEGWTPIAISARQLQKAWRRTQKSGATPAHSERVTAQFLQLEEAFDYERNLSEKHNL